jgi:hypothetical protein
LEIEEIFDRTEEDSGYEADDEAEYLPSQASTSQAGSGSTTDWSPGNRRFDFASPIFLSDAESSSDSDITSPLFARKNKKSPATNTSQRVGKGKAKYSECDSLSKPRSVIIDLTEDTPPKPRTRARVKRALTSDDIIIDLTTDSE